MANVAEVIEDLFEKCKEKIDGLRPLPGVNDDNFVNFEKECVKSHQKAVQDVLTNDITLVFGKDGGSVLDHILVNTNENYNKRHKDRNVRKSNLPAKFICDHVGCGLAFVNAGNLKNHMFAHEREDIAPTPDDDHNRSRKYKTKTSASNNPINLENTSSSSSSSSSAALPVNIELMDAESVETSPDITSSVANSMEKKKRTQGGAATRRAYSLEFKTEVLKTYDEMSKQGEICCG